jgi:hypothetical protein
MKKYEPYCTTNHPSKNGTISAYQAVTKTYKVELHTHRTTPSYTVSNFTQSPRVEINQPLPAMKELVNVEYSENLAKDAGRIPWYQKLIRFIWRLIKK